MTVETLKVLAADDEELNLEVLCHVLSREGYLVVPVKDGEEAWKYLNENPDDIDIVLLDKMMPGMDGMEVLRNIKEHPQFKRLPVIMQTASVSPNAVIEGIKAGAYYYLTKPFEEAMLVAIIHAAANEVKSQKVLHEEAGKSRVIRDLVTQSRFEFRTLEEAQSLSAFLSNYFPQPQKAVHALSALMINAVEHGNLEISYQDKSQLVTDGTWEKEVLRRSKLKKYMDRKVVVNFERDEEKITVTVKDDGNGFEWKNYIDFDPLRMTDPNGRGIAKANIMGFDKLEYNDIGNEVTCIVYTVANENEDKKTGSV